MEAADYRQQQEAEEELHWSTVMILRSLWLRKALPEDDIRILAWHCGIDLEKEVL